MTITNFLIRAGFKNVQMVRYWYTFEYEGKKIVIFPANTLGNHWSARCEGEQLFTKALIRNVPYYVKKHLSKKIEK